MGGKRQNSRPRFEDQPTSKVQHAQEILRVAFVSHDDALRVLQPLDAELAQRGNRPLSIRLLQPTRKIARQNGVTRDLTSSAFCARTLNSVNW